MNVSAFHNKETRKFYEKCLHQVHSAPFVILVKNENCEEQIIQLFSRNYPASGVNILSQVPDVSYDEICLWFFQPVKLGLFLVKILEPVDDQQIMRFMNFKWRQKDGRGNSDVQLLQPYLSDIGYERFEDVLIWPFEIVTTPLTSLEFKLPANSAIEVHLYEKK
jgi:hypothetical protein